MIDWPVAYGVIDWLSEHAVAIVAIIVTLLTLLLLVRFALPPAVKGAVARRMRGHDREEQNKRATTLIAFFSRLGAVLIITIAVFALLDEFNVNIAAGLVGLGVAGVALGFGAQSLVKDLLAGIFIQFEDQYRVGDVVTIAGITGQVEKVELRRTVLRDLDGKLHSVPNGEITVASNFTKGYSRINLDISVAYGEDLDHVVAVINDVCREMAQDPRWAPDLVTIPKVLRVNELADSGIIIKILGDTRPMRQWDAMGELRLRLKKAFDREGIEIPWPHTKVYFGNSPSHSTEGAHRPQ